MKQVALQLFHGRKGQKEDLDTWGTQGPVFIVDYVHITYQSDIKLGIPEPAGDGDLHLVDDLVYYDGVYYGDWSVFPASLIQTNDSLRSRVTTYDASKSNPPGHCTCCRHYRGTFKCNDVDCQQCADCDPD